VPALMARTHERTRSRHRRADQPVVDALTRPLLRAAQERVRRAAQPQTPAFAAALSIRASATVTPSGFFRVDMLAGRDGPKANLDMRLRHSQVQEISISDRPASPQLTARESRTPRRVRRMP